MAKGLTLTKEQILQRQNEIASIALSFFNKKGFQKTSMREIAEAAAMGKSSLYDFFTAKDEKPTAGYKKYNNTELISHKLFKEAYGDESYIYKRKQRTSFVGKIRRKIFSCCVSKAIKKAAL